MDSTPALARPNPAMVGERLFFLALQGRAFADETDRLGLACGQWLRANAKNSGESKNPYADRVREKVDRLQKQAQLVTDWRDSVRMVSVGVGAALPLVITANGQDWETALNLTVNDFVGRIRGMTMILSTIDLADEGGIDFMQRESATAAEPIRTLATDLFNRVEGLRAIAPVTRPREPESNGITVTAPPSTTPLPELHPHDREAWTLWKLGGKKQDEIAAILNRKNGTDYKQAQISRKCARFQTYANAGGIAPGPSKPSGGVRIVDPSRTALGRRVDRRTPRASDLERSDGDDGD